MTSAADDPALGCWHSARSSGHFGLRAWCPRTSADGRIAEDVQGLSCSCVRCRCSCSRPQGPARGRTASTGRRSSRKPP
eukprot:6169186-Prymnesium_polylepis.1